MVKEGGLEIKTGNEETGCLLGIRLEYYFLAALANLEEIIALAIFL